MPTSTKWLQLLISGVQTTLHLMHCSAGGLTAVEMGGGVGCTYIFRRQLWGSAFPASMHLLPLTEINLIDLLWTGRLDGLHWCLQLKMGTPMWWRHYCNMELVCTRRVWWVLCSISLCMWSEHWSDECNTHVLWQENQSDRFVNVTVNHSTHFS